MNLRDVMVELAAKLELFTNLNVFSYPPDSISSESGIVSYPENIEYDTTYGDGTDVFHDLPIWMVAGRTDSESARDKVAGWTARKGPASVKQYLDGNNYNSCDDVSVTIARFEITTIAGIDYITALFLLDVAGSGKE